MSNKTTLKPSAQNSKVDLLKFTFKQSTRMFIHAVVLNKNLDNFRRYFSTGEKMTVLKDA